MSRMSPEDRRRSLLDAGRALWASKPYDAVRPADITGATGTSIGLVYHHFGNKRGFYVATVTDLAARLVDATEPVGDDPASAIQSVLAGFVTFVDAEGPMLRAVLRGGLGVDPEIARIAQDVRDLQAQRVFTQLGLVETPELAIRIAGWIGFCETVALDHVERPRVDSDALVGLMADALWRLVS